MATDREAAIRPGRKAEGEADGSAAHPVALTIAGFDPSSGAGITADLKTFSAHGVYGLACIAALTVQSTQGVRSVEPVPAALIRQTLDCLAADFSFAGVKIGMLCRSQAVREVVAFLASQKGAVDSQKVVLDPVLRSSSGKALLDPAGESALGEELLTRVGWVTPNLHELAALTGMPSIRREEVPGAAHRLKERAARLGNQELNVVVTGGHLDRPDDFLLTACGAEFWIPGEHVATSATHGTGCAFSSALLCSLIAGTSPAGAVREAKAYVAAALRSAYPLGKGTGPMNHLFRLDPGFLA